jgi:hypothetical protein
VSHLLGLVKGRPHPQFVAPDAVEGLEQPLPQLAVSGEGRAILISEQLAMPTQATLGEGASGNAVRSLLALKFAESESILLRVYARQDTAGDIRLTPQGRAERGGELGWG